MAARNGDARSRASVDGIARAVHLRVHGDADAHHHVVGRACGRADDVASCGRAFGDVARRAGGNRAIFFRFRALAACRCRCAVCHARAGL